MLFVLVFSALKIHISKETRDRLVASTRYVIIDRGTIEIKVKITYTQCQTFVEESRGLPVSKIQARIFSVALNQSTFTHQTGF